MSVFFQGSKKRKLWDLSFEKVLKQGLAVSSACKATLVETTELRKSLVKSFMSSV